MNKAQLIRQFKRGDVFKVITEGHKYTNVPRKAEKIQTNAVRFEGGSWLYFSALDKSEEDERGEIIKFSLKPIKLFNMVEGVKYERV